MPFRSAALSAAAIFAAGLIAGAAPSRAAPRVVATVPPLHALVAQVMAGVGEPALLLRGGVSPHTYALRPSDLRALEEAQVIVWVGPPLERFMAGLIEQRRGDAVVVSIIEAEGIRLLPARRGGLWDAPPAVEGGGAPGGRDAGHDEAEHSDDAHGPIDPHLWLDPANAQAIVRAVAQALRAADPGNAARYDANAEAAAARLVALQAEIADSLTPVRRRPFVVFHDAYQYLERAFDLTALGAITVSPERPPGARRLQALERRMTEAGVRCVFVEPQFEPALARLLGRDGARLAVLDPLGSEVAPGPDAYAALLRANAAALVGCLAGD